ncbi:hypothetical protein MAUB_24690 [Mycolicibacterium aubagnense]|uniref:Cupin type-2 domain-containing protein n=1 Tax=Mycolicibacterium aubagnense TaxID=319707 RepID=A0ABM7ICZ1_9MYCO|nr:hypothetical protein MAUB_24690 [Mycolicibacterium aubagnense]
MLARSQELTMSLVVPPYPPVRYTADKPEVSATLRRGDESADYDSHGLVQYHYLANQTKTAGDYGLYRVDIAPHGGGPGPHFHRAMSEAFFVLSGTMTLYDGTDWVQAGANDFLYVPPGGVHGFRNGSDAVRAGGSAGGVLRRVRSACRHDRRRTPRVVHQARQLLRRVKPPVRYRACSRARRFPAPKLCTLSHLSLPASNTNIP